METLKDGSNGSLFWWLPSGRDLIITISSSKLTTVFLGRTWFLVGLKLLLFSDRDMDIFSQLFQLHFSVPRGRENRHSDFHNLTSLLPYAIGYTQLQYSVGGDCIMDTRFLGSGYTLCTLVCDDRYPHHIQLSSFCVSTWESITRWGLNLEGSILTWFDFSFQLE